MALLGVSEDKLRIFSDNLAEISFAAGGLSKGKKSDYWADQDSRDMMDAVKTAAWALTNYESQHTYVWDEGADWYVTCDAIAKAVMKGEPVNKNTIEKYIKE